MNEFSKSNIFASISAMFGYRHKKESPIDIEKEKIDAKFGEGTSAKVMNKIKVHSEDLNKAEAKRYRKQQKRINDQVSCQFNNDCLNASQLT